MEDVSDRMTDPDASDVDEFVDADAASSDALTPVPCRPVMPPPMTPRPNGRGADSIAACCSPAS